MWLGGIFKNSDWVWATSGSKIKNRRMQECIDNKDINNNNHCVNLDVDMQNNPKLYGIKCKSQQFFVCMENACSKRVAVSRVKKLKPIFQGKSADSRRRKKMTKTRKTTSSEITTSTSNIYPTSKLNNTTILQKKYRRNQANERSQICLNQSLPIKLNGILNIAFFTPVTYWEALKQCQSYGGNLANVNRSTMYLITEKLENCKGITAE